MKKILLLLLCVPLLGIGQATCKSGDCKNGKKTDNTQGTLIFGNGSKYVGEFQNKKKHGEGTFTFPNGSKYEGDWKENFKHGSGVFTFEDGTQYDGPFENDRMVNRQVPIKDAQVIAQQQAEIQAKAAKEKAKNDDKKQTKKKTFEAAPKKTTTTAPAKDKVDPNATHPGSSQSKFGSRAKKEVEEIL